MGATRSRASTRQIAPRTTRIPTVGKSTPSTLPNNSAVAWVAKLVKKCRKSRPRRERKGEHDADRDVPLRQFFAHETHENAGGDRHRDQAPEWRDADEHGARRAGEADMRQRVTGEGLPAQNQEIADAASDDRDHRRRGEGVAHEIIFKHANDLRGRGYARGRAHDRVHGDGRRARHRGCRTSRRCDREYG